MPDKTELMELYEQQHPGKHAIWRGKITNQFKDWKKHQKSADAIFQKDIISHKIVVYMALSHKTKPTFVDIIDFSTSFGLKTNDIISVLIQKIQEADIEFDTNDDKELEKIYEGLISRKNLDFPLTIEIREAFDLFRDLDFQKPVEIVKFFQTLHNKYPDFLTLSSSSFDKQANLITFKAPFPNTVKFQLINRWG